MHAYGSPPHQFQEHTFFVGPGVTVTNARFCVFQAMYPINAITSVAPFYDPAKRGWLIFWACFFGLGALGGLGNMASGSGGGGGFIFCTLAVGLFILVAMSRKDTHGVVMTTSGMQVRALTSQDPAFVQQVVAALHQAIASR